MRFFTTRTTFWLLLSSIILSACNLAAASPPEPTPAPIVLAPAATAEATSETTAITRTSVAEAIVTEEPADDNESSQQTVDTAPAVLPPACEPRTDWVIYTVVAGDTLSRIARRINTTANELARANCLADANALDVGQLLYVPSLPPPVPEPSQACRITVQQRTPIINAPQGTGRTTLGYLDAGTTVTPVVHFEGLPYWGFWYGDVLGWVDAQPTGDCSNVSDQPPRLDDDRPERSCVFIASRSDPVWSQQAFSVDTLGNLNDGSVYPFVEVGSYHQTGANTGYWLHIVWDVQQAVTGYVMDGSGELVGDCPTVGG